MIVTDRLSWKDAQGAAQWLSNRSGDRRTMIYVAWLPLVHEYVIEELVGLRGGASIYRSLGRLRAAGLLATISPPLYPGRSQELYYLTDLGLATLAFDQGIELVDLVHRLHLGGPHLRSFLPRLDHLVGLYDLLGALAACRAGPSALLAWERPWRGRYHRPTAKTPISVTVPAYAALSWDDEPGAFFLVPDRGIIPLRLYRPLINQLFGLRRMEYTTFPVLVVATRDERRQHQWHEMLEDIRRLRNDVDLLARITLWGELRTGLAGIERLSPVQDLSVSQLRSAGYCAPCTYRRRNGPLPRPVGTALCVPPHPTVADGVERVALRLSPADYTLLALVAAHPFLPLDGVATVLNSSIASTRRRHNRLISMGLIRLVTAEEIGGEAARQLSELTGEGLELVAAYHGLSLPVAIRELGLVGGGDDQPVGARRPLLRQLAHTMGADDIFVRLYRTAAGMREVGGDDALLEWHNATACSRRHLRPDGYGLYCRGGWLHHFFVEYDRGTMRQHGYLQKFAEYYRYGVSRRYERDYGCYPMILMITTTTANEEHITRAALRAATYWGRALPLLLTCQWRIDELSNPDGLLGPIWRGPDADLDDRRCWLPTPGLESHGPGAAASGQRKPIWTSVGGDHG